MTDLIVPCFEFRIFGNHLEKYEKLIDGISKKEMTRQMESVYLLSPWKRKNNVKIRQGVMDIKVQEQEYKGLEQWSPFLVGEFPLKADVIRTTVFPALGVESPVFERAEYSLKQFINEIVCVDPDLAVAYVWKTRHAYTVAGCITEIAEIRVNGTYVKTICVESDDPEKVSEAKKLLEIDKNEENVNYPLALKRFMGLNPLPDKWKRPEF